MYPNETIIIAGNIALPDGTFVSDASNLRISDLCNHYLIRLGARAGAKGVLYRDPADGRLWERIFPHGEVQGGGLDYLQVVDDLAARIEYGDRVVDGSS